MNMRNVNRTIVCAGTVALAAASLVLTARTGHAQNGPEDPPVKLQSSTPGTGQIGHGNITGTFRAGYLKGNGLGITGINANNVAVGTLNDARLSSNVPRLNGANTFGSTVNVLGRVGIGGVSAAYAQLIVRNGDLFVADDQTGASAKLGFVQGTAAIALSAPGGGGIVNIGPASANGTTGYVGVSPAEQSAQAGMYVDPNHKGVLFADIKNFRVPNPRNDSEDIVYACVEGPEAGAYDRGTARLVNGHARVDLPQHFRDVTVSMGLTVQLTACSRLSKGLAVENRSNTGFDVYELGGGHGSYEVDWEVKAVRRGHEDYRPVRSWDEALPGGADRSTAWSQREAMIRRGSESQGSAGVRRP